MSIRYASVCDGIGAAHQAWAPLGWSCAWTSEVAPFPSAVVEKRWGFPNVGDMLNITEKSVERHGAIELLVGGTPCQSFSVAGLRGGLDDPRGNLAIRFLQLAGLLRPRWLVWENVPGVLSSNGGRDFGAILGGMVKLGYGVFYRVLDAQFVRVDGHARAVPQRRRRVFAVGYLGDWRRAAAVLLERESMSGHPPPRREAGKVAAAPSASGVGTCGADDNQAQHGHLIPSTGDVSHCPNAGGMGRCDLETETLVAHTLKGEGHDASEDGTGRGVPLIPFDTTQITNSSNYSNPKPGQPCHPLASGAHPPAVAFDCKATDAQPGDISPTIRGMGHHKSHANAGGQVAVNSGMTVRRLTPVEAERLQGFPDDYTAITYRGKLASDGPRYKALGASMAVNVMRWIGERIMKQEAEA